MSSLAAERIPTAASAEVADDKLTIELDDGRTVAVPLAWYPRLLHASDVERQNLRVIGKGQGLHWPDLDEDISVASVLQGKPSMEDDASLKRWLDGRR